MEIEENTYSNTTQVTKPSDDSYEEKADLKRSRSSKQKKMSFREEVMLKKQKLDSFLRDRKQWDVNYFLHNIKPFLKTLHVRNRTVGVSLTPLNHVSKKTKRLSHDGAVERDQIQPLESHRGTIVRFARPRGKVRGDEDNKSSKSEPARLKLINTSKEGSSQDADSRNIGSVHTEGPIESNWVPKTEEDSVMARKRANVSSKEVLNGHAGTTVHDYEAQRSRRAKLSTMALQTSPSSGSSETENSRSLLSKQSGSWTESTDKSDSDFNHTRVRFLLDDNNLVRGYTLMRGNTHLTKEDLNNLTFRPQINDKRVINKTYTGEDTYYMALESARLKKRSSELDRDNLYRSVQHIPLYKRTNYMLGRPQAKQYRYIQDIYGKSEKNKRARQFFEKLEEVQKEDFRKRLEELIEREKLKMETKEKQREQLAYLRQKFEDDAWKRFMTQYVTSRVLAHEHQSRHVYGLPEDLDSEPEFEAKLKRKKLIPKPDTDPVLLSRKNKKKYQQMFEVRTGPTWQTNDRPPKLEGIDSVYFEDEDEKGKPLRKRRNVTEILEEAQAMLQMAEEELNESMPSSHENASKIRSSYPKRTETKRAQQSRGSSPDQYIHRASPKTKTTEKKNPPTDAKIQAATYQRDIVTSNSPSREKEGRTGLRYINDTQQTHIVTGQENHKTHVLPSTVRQRSVKIESPSSSSYQVYQPTSKSVDYAKVNNIYDADKRESDQNLPNIKQQNKGILKGNGPQPERDEILPTTAQPTEKRNDPVPRQNDANSTINNSTVKKDSASQKLDEQSRHNPTMSAPKEEVRLTYFKDPVSGAVPIPSLENHQQKHHPSTTEDSDEDDTSGKKVTIRKIITKTVTTKQETKPATNPNVHQIKRSNSNTGKIKPSDDWGPVNGGEQQSTRFNHPTLQHNSRDSRDTTDLKHSSHVDPNTSRNDESDKKTVIKVTTTTTKDVPKDSDRGKSNQTVKSKVEVRTEPKSDNKDYEKLISFKRIPTKTTADIQSSRKESESNGSKINKDVINTKTAGSSKKKSDAVKVEDSSTEKKNWRVNLDKYLSQPETAIDRTDERSLLSTKINDDDDDDMSDIFERARRKYNLDIDDDDDD